MSGRLTGDAAVHFEAGEIAVAPPKLVEVGTQEADLEAGVGLCDLDFHARHKGEQPAGDCAKNSLSRQDRPVAAV
jgi:hypothetical protein